MFLLGRNKGMSCPARAESLLPGKGWQNDEAMFYCSVLQLQKKCWIWGFYRTTIS